MEGGTIRPAQREWTTAYGHRLRELASPRWLRVLQCLLLLAATVGGTAAAQPELVAREAIATAVGKAFSSHDFDSLEQMARSFLHGKSRTSSGLWKLSILYIGLENAMLADDPGEDEAFEQLKHTIRAWQRRHPDSSAASIAMSILLIDRAWAVRGNGNVWAVRPAELRAFKHHIRLARENLEASKLSASRDPSWYETMLRVAFAESWDRVEFDTLLDEALEQEPLFYETYFRAWEYLLRNSQGDMSQLEEFARYAIERTSHLEGQGLYARIYWYASQSKFHLQLFTRSSASWATMKAGFEDVLREYPDAWNLNNFTKFACLAGDKRKSRELIRLVQHELVAEAWQSRQLLIDCWQWSTEDDGKGRI